MMKYLNAQNAFQDMFYKILLSGEKINNTRALHHISFQIENPIDNHITDRARNWSLEYAQKEWLWYLSENPSVSEIGKYAKLWNSLADVNGDVNSNYGYQWSRGRQLNRVISQLIFDSTTRKAAISIFDGKEYERYHKDTPCTYSIGFNVTHGKLVMLVNMRSCDLIWGFCNDQYCFSQLHQLVANSIQKPIGHVTYMIQSFHVYERHFAMEVLPI